VLTSELIKQLDMSGNGASPSLQGCSGEGQLTIPKPDDAEVKIYDEASHLRKISRLVSS
jgi:hypothetical protein